VDPITSDLYDEAQKSGLPEKAILASLGCGNPTALAELKKVSGRWKLFGSQMLH
jgi:hypothetical protein